MDIIAKQSEQFKNIQIENERLDYYNQFKLKKKHLTRQVSNSPKEAKEWF